MRLYLSLIALGILMLFQAPLAISEVEPAPEQPEATTPESTMRTRVIELSKLSAEQVDGLRANNYGWGEILHVGALVNAGQSYDAILADRASGMGWGQIAKKYDLKLGELRRNVHAGIDEAKKTARADKNAKRELAQLAREVKQIEKQDAKPEKPNRPERPSKPEKPAKPGR